MRLQECLDLLHQALDELLLPCPRDAPAMPHLTDFKLVRPVDGNQEVLGAMVAWCKNAPIDIVDHFLVRHCQPIPSRDPVCFRASVDRYPGAAKDDGESFSADLLIDLGQCERGWRCWTTAAERRCAGLDEQFAVGEPGRAPSD